MPRSLRPFTVEHFKVYCSRLVFDDGERRPPEPWQLDYARDVFRGVDETGKRQPGADRECWLLVPEGNGKTTFVAQLALYGCDWAPRPWIPVGASSRDQAKILYTQAKGFVDQTPGLQRRFRCFDGYRAIRPLIAPMQSGVGGAEEGRPRPGRGIEICPWDPDTNDGTIPFPYAINDELHRHEDMRLYRLWKGKLNKRGARILAISTAGEPGTEFEEARDRIRQRAVTRVRRYGGTHYRGGGMSMYEFMLNNPEECQSARRVLAVNPLSSVTEAELQEELESLTFDIGDWKRLKCNLPARSVHAAITDDEWANARVTETAIPEGERIDCGLDLGWKWDTTSIAPIWRGPDYRLLDEANVIVPPRDGTSLHPDRIKEQFVAINERNPIDAVVMDMSDGADVAAWLEDDLGVEVVDRSQGNDLHVMDYKHFMRGLRTGELRIVQSCPLLTRHSMNAIARRLPRGDFRFDRPDPSRNRKRQDRRVIDALTAAGMVVTHTYTELDSAVPLVAVSSR